MNEFTTKSYLNTNLNYSNVNCFFNDGSDFSKTCFINVIFSTPQKGHMNEDGNRGYLREKQSSHFYQHFLRNYRTNMFLAMNLKILFLLLWTLLLLLLRVETKIFIRWLKFNFQAHLLVAFKNSEKETSEIVFCLYLTDMSRKKQITLHYFSIILKVLGESLV